MPQMFETDSPSMEEIRKIRKPRTHSVWLPLDADLLTRIADLEVELHEAKAVDEREHRRAKAPGIATELETLRLEAEQSAVKFTFVELPRKVYRDLIEEHPGPAGLRWDEETFAPALIAASAIGPLFTLDDAQDVWDNWGHAYAYAVFDAAYQAQEGKVRVPFTGSSTAETDDSRQSSTTADLED